MSKVCTRCKREMEETEFYPKARACKKCYNRKAKEYYQANKERILTKQRNGNQEASHTYYWKNREKILAKAKSRKQKRDPKSRQAEYQRKKALGQTWYQKNRERVLANRRHDPINYQKNREKLCAANKIYREKNREKTRERKRKYRERNREKIRAHNRMRFKKRIARDIAFRLMVRCRQRIRLALKGNINRGKTVELIGCTSEHLKRHIQSQFLPHMHWNNQGNGKGKWNIDHIIPCEKFDLTQKYQQLMCFNWRNLRPLWWVTNLKKGAKFVGTMPLLECL